MKIHNSYKPELRNPQANQLKKYSQNNSQIFLLRHGRIKGFSEKRYIGNTDVDLDEKGILQAEYWKNQFSSVKINSIYSSSLKRCTNTAKIIKENTKIITETSLNEINMGEWDGQTFSMIKTEQPKEFEKRGRDIDTYRPPGGESFYDLSCRALPFFQGLASRIQKNVLIVTHAGVIRTILCNISNLELKDLFKIKVSYGELFVIGLNNKCNK